MTDIAQEFAMSMYASTADRNAAMLAEIERLRAENDTLRGAMAANDERLRVAGERVGIIAGCDTAELMADEIERLLAEVEQLRQYLDAAQRRASALGDEVAGLRGLLANIIEKRCKYGWGFETDAAIDAALAARKGAT